MPPPTFEQQVSDALRGHGYDSDGGVFVIELEEIAPRVAAAIEAAMAKRYYDSRHAMRQAALAALVGLAPRHSGNP